MTRRETAQSIRELGQLMEHFAGHEDDDELNRLCDRTQVRLNQMRTLIRLSVKEPA